MLNRRHIRIKTLQSLYSYWSSDGTLNEKDVEHDFKNNINRLYDLYLYMLLFLKEFAHFIEIYDDEVKSKHIPSAKEININSRLYENPIISRIAESEELSNLLDTHKLFWDPEDNIVLRKVFLDLKNSEVYKEYIHTEDEKKFEDFGILSYLIKHYPFNFAFLEQHFEEKFINWLDDGRIAVHMVNKTLQQISDDPEIKEFILPLSTNIEESYDFAFKLFRESIKDNEYFEKLINKKIDKWEPSRVAIMDKIILKMGLCEFVNFPNIPIRVTINECIELAKNYSTPNSKKFINGVLDNLLTELKKGGKINKSGLGLIEGSNQS